MPNSSWTESGSSISLVPVTTTIDPGSSPNNVNYLTNTNKIALMSQYAAELAMKTSLDTLASTWSVSSTFYDNAIAAISTALINAGAPSNWATTWPDGTTSGPWPGIQTSLANLWAQVATQRTGLQSSISSAQAAAAQATAIAAAAATSTTQMNNAIATAQAAASTAQTNAITAANTAASNAQAAAIATAAAMGASESIIPNGGFTAGNATGWSFGDVGSGGWTFGALPNGSQGITLPGGSSTSASSPAFQVIPGKKYKLIFWVYAGSGTQAVYLRAYCAPSAAANITSVNQSAAYSPLANGSVTTAGVAYYSFDWTPAAAQNFVSLCVYEWGGTAPVYIQGLFCVPYVEAAYIDAGAVTTNALAASSVTATNIAAGAVTTSALAAGSVTTNALAAGSVNTSILAANAVQAQNIAAGAITTNKLTVSNTGLALNADPYCLDATAWAIGDGGTFSMLSVSDGVAGPGAIQLGGADVRSNTPIPISSSKTYRVRVTARAVGASTSGCYIRLYQYSAGTSFPSTSYPASNLGMNLGYENITISTTWTTYTATVTPATGAALGLLSFHGSWGGSTPVQFQDFELTEMSDASLIVDGTITASKIEAGAITADMITTGTLNAANVAVTNLNASNITTGTLSANMVLFPDGSELSTASRVANYLASGTGNVSVTGATKVAIPGLTFTVSATSTLNVYNLQALLQADLATYASNCTLFVYAVVDGNTSTPADVIQFAFTVPSSLYTAVSASGFLSITGLAAGSHTISLYASSAGNFTIVGTPSRCLLQRVY